MNEPDTIERDEVARKNRDALISLMEQHNLFVPAREFDKWRATTPTDGRIEGVVDGLTCIATNGLLGYFLRADREPFYGHVQHFMWDTPIITMVSYLKEDGTVGFFKSVREQGAPGPLFKADHAPKPKKLSAKPKKKSKTQQALDML